MTSVAVLNTAICDFLWVGCAAIEDVDAWNKSGQGFFRLRRHIRPETIGRRKGLPIRVPGSARPR